MSIQRAFIDQLDRQFATLEGVYDRANRKAWDGGDPRVKCVWRWLLHILETIDYYTTEEGEFEFCKRFGVDWEDPDASPVPSPKALREYQDQLKEKVRHELISRPSLDFIAREERYPWTGEIFGARLIYLCRHTQQHIGDINMVLRLNDCDVLEWH